MAAIPAALVPSIKGLLLRADQFEKSVASRPEFGKLVYYLRYAAASVAVRAMSGGGFPAAQAGAADAFVGALIGQLDGDKARFGIDSAAEAADVAYVQEFALDTFRRADDADRAGATDRGVGQAFATAGVLLDVVRTVEGERASPKLALAGKYAKGRASDILTAFRDGRAPPPPAGAGADAAALAELGFDMPLAPSAPVVAAAAAAAASAAGGSGAWAPAAGGSGAWAPAPAAAAAGGGASWSPAPAAAASGGGGFVPAAPPAGSSGSSSVGGAEAVRIGGGGGGGGGGDDTEMYTSLNAAAAATSSPAAYAAAYPTPAAPSPAGGFSYAPLPAAAATPAPTPVGGSSRPVAAFTGPAGALADSAEFTKYALAALRERDAALAAKFLRQALAALGNV